MADAVATGVQLSFWVDRKMNSRSDILVVVILFFVFIWAAHGVHLWLRGYCFEKDKFVSFEEIMHQAMVEFGDARIQRQRSISEKEELLIDEDYMEEQCNGNGANCCRLNYSLPKYGSSEFNQNEMRKKYSPGASNFLMIHQDTVEIGCELENKAGSHRWGMAISANYCGDEFDFNWLFEKIGDVARPN